MRKVVIIGGGFAGLSAGTSLAQQDFQVTILEGRQVLGGRAYSFTDPQMQDTVDNGQHLFMGCYYETQRFLDRIGTLQDLRFQRSLSVDFLGDRGRKGSLKASRLPAPWHLLSGLAQLSTLSLGDRARLRHMRAALKRAPMELEKLDQITVEDWLKAAHQSERARRDLWDLIAIATLNEDPAIAAASTFATVLSRAFFEGRQASRLGLSSVGLSDLYTGASMRYIEMRHGDVRTKAPVEHIVFEGKLAKGVQMRQGEFIPADFVISSVPASAFSKLLPETIAETLPAAHTSRQLKFAPIISIHLWFDRPISDRMFAAMLDTQVQWFFNTARIHRNAKDHGHITLVISGAHRFVTWKDTKISSMAMEELYRLFPNAKEAILRRSLVIKELQATLSPTLGTESLRPESATCYPNFFIAGDWTKTGLPATIESACVSGHLCASLVLKSAQESTETHREVTHA